MRWPDRFYEIKRGDHCPLCQQERPDQTADGVRFFCGTYTDAYLSRRPTQRGLTVVIWRGRHVAEPTELNGEESAGYWRELLFVGRAIEIAFAPVKLNYDTLGNSVPHLHTHIVPRYAEDPRPGWPFPCPDPDPAPAPIHRLSDDLSALQRVIHDLADHPSG